MTGAERVATYGVYGTGLGFLGAGVSWRNAVNAGEFGPINYDAVTSLDIDSWGSLEWLTFFTSITAVSAALCLTALAVKWSQDAK